MDKRAILEGLISQLRSEIEGLTKNLESIQQTVNDAPSASQSHSDTTRFQTSQLEGQVSRALRDKERSLQILGRILSLGTTTSEKVAVGSLVEINDAGDLERYFILPEGGGLSIEDGDQEITVLTPQAPLADQLFDRRVGETISLKVPRGTRSIKIVSIQ